MSGWWLAPGGWLRNSEFTNHQAPTTILSSFPPDVSARADGGEWHEQNCQPPECALLRFGHGQASIGRALRMNRNQVFILGKPVDRVEEKVAVAQETNAGVGGEIGIAEDDQSRLFIADLFGPGHAERDRALGVFALIEFGFTRFCVGFGPAVFRSLQNVGE